MFVLSVMDALVKWLAADYHFLQVLFFRNFFAFVPMFAAAAYERNLRSVLPRRPVRHIWRSGLMIAASLSFFYGLSRLPLVDCVMIGFAAPVFMTALSVPLLGERVGARRWAAVLLGFLGVIAILRPDLGVPDLPTLVVTASAVLYAMAMIMTRTLAREEPSLSLVFVYSCMATVATGVTMPFVWVAPVWSDAPLLFLVGLLGGFGQILIVHAYRRAPVSTLAPHEYMVLVWAGAFGYFIWNEVPTTGLIIGGVLLIGGGLALARMEAKGSG
jgi:drug/metabolite transporter (DMT)-like permease